MVLNLEVGSCPPVRNSSEVPDFQGLELALLTRFIGSLLLFYLFEVVGHESQFDELVGG